MAEQNNSIESRLTSLIRNDLLARKRELVWHFISKY